MTAPALLDLTRLFRRRHTHHDTGIDRVERGYFETFKLNPENGYIIYGGQGVSYLFDASGADAALLLPSNAPLQTHFALWRRARSRLSAKSLQGYTRYFNVGHSGQRSHFYDRLKTANVQIVTMIHDTIPIDYPEFTRPDQVTRFREKFDQFCAHSDAILTPSAYSAAQIQAHAPHVKNIQVTPLAVTFRPDCAGFAPENAFLILGTIEPRKNHMTIFRVWERLYEQYGYDCPKLWLIGGRGWNIDNEISFLESSPLVGKVIFELGAVDDKTLANRLCRAKCLLFPSFVEGFGLPIFEAALAKKGIIASNIPVFGEIKALPASQLVSPTDEDAWLKAIDGETSPIIVDCFENWSQHIDLVNQLI